MKKITRNEFIEAMTSAPHNFIFCGYEVDGFLPVDGLIPGALDSTRSVVSVRPTFLEFSGGSRLYLSGCKFERFGSIVKVTTKADKVLVYVLKDD